MAVVLVGTLFVVAIKNNMALNTSSKICISKRLTIASLLLFAVGFSVVVFSTLSSSVNKTTSSKASGTDSTTLKDFGGKNQPCKLDDPRRIENRELICNEDTELVCSAPLDFWLRSKDNRDYSIETKCLEDVDIPMGKEGQLCRKASQGIRQCDSGFVCVNVFKDEKDKPAGLSQTFEDYLVTKYKGDKRLDKELMFAISNDATRLRIYFRNYNNQYYSYGATGIPNFVYMYDTNKNLVEPRGVCIPDSFTKVESCGDAGQKACYDGQKHYCFDNNRRIYSVEVGEYRCAPKISIGSKGFVKCDDTSGTCSEYCSKQNAKCVDTCDRKVLKRAGDEYYEKIEKVGAYHDYKDGNDSLGACEDRYLSNQTSSSRNNISLTAACSVEYQTYCCCDKK